MFSFTYSLPWLRITASPHEHTLHADPGDAISDVRDTAHDVAPIPGITGIPIIPGRRMIVFIVIAELNVNVLLCATGVCLRLGCMC